MIIPFHNLTPRLQQALALAKKASSHFHSAYVGTEHFLMGLAQLGQGVAINILNKMGIRTEDFLALVETQIKSEQAEWSEKKDSRSSISDKSDKRTSKSSFNQDIVLSPQAKSALEFATKEAIALGHSYVGTEHLLLGLIRTENGLAFRILKGLNIHLDDCRKEILAELNPNYSAENNNDSESSDDDDSNSDGDNDNGSAHTHNDDTMPFAEASAVNHPSSSLQNGARKEKKEGGDRKNPVLRAFGRDLTERAINKELDPVIGRTKEIERVIQILCRRTKNNPILIGEAGVGKTAIVEGLAQAIADGKAPEPLLDKRIIILDLALMVAGTKYRGQFEERLKTAMDEIRRAKNIIIFLDELHTIVGAGSAEGAMDASNILKPALSRGEIQCIGATTVAEYRKHIEKDSALDRRFQGVNIDPPSVEETILILKGIQKKYEEHHKITFSESAVELAAKLSDRYITGRHLPDKAIDVLDEAGSKCRISALTPPPFMEKLQAEIDDIHSKKEDAIRQQRFEEAAKFRDEEKKLKDQQESKVTAWRKTHAEKFMQVTDEDIFRVVSTATGIPLMKIEQKESKKLLNLEKDLQSLIIGQDHATEIVGRTLRRSRADLKDPKRPIGSFLFLGPTGVGKSFLAKLIAEKIFGSKEAIIQIDMSEYMEKFAVSRMIGSPPGYVGHEEGGQLTEAVRRKPYSVILFDEIEKAHPDVIQILLQVLEEGRLTDSLGRSVDFRNTILIITSNVGAEILQRDTALGFHGGSANEDFERIKEHIQEATKKAFKPEFLNRIGEIVVFRPLLKEHIERIIDIELSSIQKRLQPRNIQLKLHPLAKAFLVEKGYDKKYGARPLKRALERFLEDPLAEAILKEEVKHDVPLQVVLANDKKALQFIPIEPKTNAAEKPSPIKNKAKKQRTA
jgi:ATP-dependent Clp protease ATP-binding subunit ClpC